MKRTTMILFGTAISLCLAATCVRAQSSAFGYQGQLTRSGHRANGLYEMEFTLFDAENNGNQVATPVAVAPVSVSNGLFTVTLDFGAAPFGGAARWLEITVNVYGSDQPAVLLSPRQLIASTPYAIRAAHFSGSIADGQLSPNVARLNANQTFTGAANFSSSANRFAGAFSGNGAGVSNVNLATITSDGAITPAYPDLSFALSSSPAAGDGSQGVAAADVNGDGRPDLITANLHADTLSILTNDGSGGFTLASSPSVGDGPVMVAAADVSGDGSVDLMCANFYGGRISVLFNNGSGAFILASSLAVGREPASIAAADLNGDGYVDLVTANIRDDNLSLLTNNGSGGFALSASPAAGDGPISVCVADVNGDGRPDVVSANRDGDNLSVLTNRGGGVFVLSSSPSVGHFPFWITPADVNGDNRVDLISANLADSTLSVLTNDGSGGFAVAATPDAGYTPYSLVASDFNRDGHVDLACANQFSASLRVLTNDGTGAFVFAMTLTADEGSVGVAASDLNRDGRTDLVCANWIADNLSIFLQDSGPPTYTFSGNFTGTANLSGTFSGDGSGLSVLDANSLTSGTVPASALDNAWKIDGNAGTTPGMHFLGTTDDQPLELKVNGQRALRLEPRPGDVPNVIGGSVNNVMQQDVAGSVISGGYNNVIGSDASGDWSTIGGGSGNAAGKNYATIGGGDANNISALTTLVPDENNPGEFEQVTGDNATINGGQSNSVAGAASTIAGGSHNVARGDYATVSGGSFNHIEPSLFNSYGGTIAGGSSNRVDASSYSSILGGLNNTISFSYGCAVGGGYDNSVQANATASVIAGGDGNIVAPRVIAGAIGGGQGNRIHDSLLWATIAGGQANTIGPGADAATIGGGRVNEIQLRTLAATVSGGEGNRIETQADYASLLGGRGNSIASNATAAVVAGGFGNYAGGAFAFAAGQRARAEHSGAFVWADAATDATISSTASNQFTARASGGVRFFTDTNATAGAELAPGSGSWSSVSDRNAKENFAAVDTQAILQQMVGLPLSTWNYKAQDKSVRHLGPTAQEFKEAFALGESDRAISSVDADGVALAAIQGLNQKLEETIAEKERRIRALEITVSELKDLVGRLSSK